MRSDKSKGLFCAALIVFALAGTAGFLPAVPVTEAVRSAVTSMAEDSAGPDVSGLSHDGGFDSVEFPFKSSERVEESSDVYKGSSVELNTIIFTPARANDAGIYYVSRQGVDAIAYFGVSEVYYCAGNTLLRLEFPGSRQVIPVGEQPTGSVTNYVYGNSPSCWQTGLNDYAVLRYTDIYPGIDLAYRSSNGALKYEFIVAAGADPAMIRLDYPDADAINVQNRQVTVSKGASSITDEGLCAFQRSSGAMGVVCAFQPLNGNTIGYHTGHYDDSQELTIDPVLVRNTFLGGSSEDVGRHVVVESGYAYVTGYTMSTDFATAGEYDATHNGNSDCFVTKFAVDGMSLIYSTFLGGVSGDVGLGIAVENGYAYIAGETWSADFPTVNALDAALNGSYDGFVTKLAANGQSLIYSTFLGGSNYDTAGSLAVESGYAYVTGYTTSPNFPTANAFDQTWNWNHDCFVSKLAINGSALVYSTFLGGESTEDGTGIAVESGHAYVTGCTFSADFPAVNAFDQTLSGSYDCFVTKLALNGSALVYSTFLGGIANDVARGIAVHGGYAYVTGETASAGFPTASAYDSIHNGYYDCFVTKLAVNGSALIYSTFLGGPDGDYGYGIAVESGCVYVTGSTVSATFPTINAFDPTYCSGRDCFVTKLAVNGSALVYSTFLGGSDNDVGYSIAADTGCVYLTGYTRSANFSTVRAYDSTYNGGIDCFLSVIGEEDSDMDGLTDQDEAAYGTNPLCIDSDNDNFLDGYEVAYGSDPLDPMSYPAMPQAWYQAIYEDLDGNATLIQNLLAWTDGNTSLLQIVMRQLDSNATALQQVIGWLDENHTAMETLFTRLDGNATLLLQTVSAVNGNATLIQNMLTWCGENATLLENVINQVNTLESTDLAQILSWLDGNHTAIQTLFTYVSGNASLLLSVVRQLDRNATRLELVAALANRNSALLLTLNASVIGNIDEIRAILDQLGVTVGDTDYDGLDDLEEIALGTNLQCIDTDCDNLNDAYEVKIGTDPTDDDSDDDTYYDGAEVLAGTDPLDGFNYPGRASTTATTTTGPSRGLELIGIAGAVGLVGIVVLLVLARRRIAPRAAA